jgi:hypothetical protein
VIASGRLRHLLPCAAVAAASAAIAYALVAGRGPVVFWDTESYLAYARALADGRIPRRDLRMPGYPAFVLVAGGAGLHLGRIVLAQVALWIAANGLVYAAVRRLTGSVATALAVGLAAVVSVDLLFMSITVYSETLALFLVDAAAVSTVMAFRGARPGAWAGAAASLWALAALVRPLFVIALGIFLLALAAAAIRRVVPARAVVAAAAIALLVVGGWSTVNLARSGTFRFSHGAGLSLLNAVGFPEVHARLPDDHAAVRDVYLELARRNGAPVAWWDAIGPLMARAGEADGNLVVRDRFATRTALRSIAAAPLGYATVWARALRDFLSDSQLLYGWYPAPDAASPQWPAGTWQHAVVNRAHGAWSTGLRAVTYGSLLLPAVAALLLVATRRRAPRSGAGGEWGFFTLFAIAAAVALLNTAVEPWPGQMRYRYPVQHLQLAIAAASVALVARGAARLLRGEEARLPDGANARRGEPWTAA